MEKDIVGYYGERQEITFALSTVFAMHNAELLYLFRNYFIMGYLFNLYNT